MLKSKLNSKRHSIIKFWPLMARKMAQTTSPLASTFAVDPQLPWYHNSFFYKKKNGEKGNKRRK